MPIIRFTDEAGEIRWGEDLGDGTAMVLAWKPPAPPVRTGERLAVAALLAPVEPVNIFGIGLNYRKHAMETGKDLPERPVVFMKPTSAAIGPGEPILLPRCQIDGPEVDYECELAAVIGTVARDVPVERALDHVLGFTCANDVSARRWQKRAGGGQWVRGKGFDTFCPLGPGIVTPDEIGDPQKLALRSELNGEVMQESSTADMVFSVAELVSFLSADTTLLPGTVILTGTPEGVGFARRPPVFLRPGDEVTVEVEGIGRLTNPVRAAV